MDTAERRRAPRLDAAGMPARVLHTARPERPSRKIKENKLGQVLQVTLHTRARRHDTLLHYHARCVKVVRLEATLQHRRNVGRP